MSVSDSEHWLTERAVWTHTTALVVLRDIGYITVMRLRTDADNTGVYSYAVYNQADRAVAQGRGLRSGGGNDNALQMLASLCHFILGFMEQTEAHEDDEFDGRFQEWLHVNPAIEHQLTEIADAIFTCY